MHSEKEGLKIKLKMGNDKENIKEDSTEENKSYSTSEQKTDIETQSDDKKKDEVEKLRKVIKVNEPHKEDKKTQEINSKEDVLEDESRASLEQKRAILQSIKDFDFQIKKNQEEITTINEKLESVSKDLDDLVSLYEIVSEQMNPFVGLSKVTKKRIDALENFTKEIEDLKTRMGDLESFAETAGINFEEIKSQRVNDGSAKKSPQDIKNKDEWTNGDVDAIIEKAFSSMTMDNEIDNLIDEFIENLKDVNIN